MPDTNFDECTYAVGTRAMRSMNNHQCLFLRRRKCDEPAMLNRTHLDRAVQHHLERELGAVAAAAGVVERHRDLIG